MTKPRVRRRRLEHERRQVALVSKSAVKQFVRNDGWLQAARRRYQLVHRPLVLFTLCGEDALDVILFTREGLLLHDSRGYPGVCWCELSEETAARLAVKLGHVKRSFTGKLETLSQTPEFADWFPFDVVNLDFTSQPFPGWQPPMNTTWEAIERILELQRDRRQGFELFVTFNASHQGASRQAVRQLINITRTNLTNKPWSSELFLRSSNGMTPQQIASSSYDSFLLLCLPKFVGKMATDNGFVVHDLLRFCYWRHPPKRPPYRIIKLLFSLDPPILRRERLDDDPLHEAMARSYDEIVKSAFDATWTDVDGVLSSTPGLEQQLRSETATLLTLYLPTAEEPT